MPSGSKSGGVGDSRVEVGGRRLRLTNLDKVLYPEAGFTKGQVVDYYARVAPALLPHLAGRPLTMVRWPDGVEGERFFDLRRWGTAQQVITDYLLVEKTRRSYLAAATQTRP